MKIKKFALLGIVLCLLIFSTTVTVTAQAYSYSVDSPIPTFGLYCEEDDIIQSGTVKFDLSDSELFTNKKALKESEYIVSGAQTVMFEIPFLSSYIEIPQFNVTVNGQAVNGKVWYGENEIRYGSSNSYLNALSTDNSVIEEKLKMTYSPILDETIIGTMYIVTPDTDTFTITLNLEKSYGYVYDETNRRTVSNSADGTTEWIYENALSQASYQYFFVGDNNILDFSATCDFQTQTITLKDFIDLNYNNEKEYYESVGVSSEFIYANANRLLENKSGMAFCELFYDSLCRIGLNSYKFTVQLNGEATIKYSSEVVIQADYRYEPTVYLIGQKQIGCYPTNYSITLNNEVSYIVQSSVDTKKSKKVYTASSTENFYFICCSASWQGGLSTTQLIICIVFGSLGGIGIIVLIVNIILFVRDKRKVK